MDKYDLKMNILRAEYHDSLMREHELKGEVDYYVDYERMIFMELFYVVDERLEHGSTSVRLRSSNHNQKEIGDLQSKIFETINFVAGTRYLEIR